jgi:hypothetical protein
MSGLSPNIRLQEEPEEAAIAPMDVTVENADEEPDVPEFDTDGAVLRIDHGDGSITVSLDGKPIEDAEGKKGPTGWFDNLADDIDDDELSSITEDLLRGVQDDLESRNEWIDDRAQGIKLLGLKIELPGVQGASDGAPVEGMSKVRHPLLQEAVLRFQANARSELLPTDGPVKIRDDANGTTLERDQLADALEKDMNHYLTSTAREYYPDTDRMLLLLGFGGTAFKKIYFCPLRNRPASDSVDADDLIVNNKATDLSSALRVTHRVTLKPSTVKRLQILGVYRDVELSTPKEVTVDAAQEAKASQQGISVTVSNPDDRDREIYEVYCELDIKGYEHKHKGKPSGLEIPYRVTIDISSREILSIVRNYDEDTSALPEARTTFVKYTFVPGLGFYDIGLLHILGNTTNAVTAAWRELLDAGMFANFPGFLMSDSGARQNTNVFRVPPGGAALVKTGGQRIGDAIMPLPYKEPSSALMALTENMAQTGMRVGGTSELQVGEGRSDAPVGTTLAMIEQAMKVLNAVHKRMHSAQAEEFTLLVKCFREHPESFWQRNRKPSVQWDEEKLMQALTDVELVPQADPNTSSHAQRVMKIMALKQLQAASPALYDEVAVDKAALKAIGWSNPEQFLKPESARNQMPPEMMKGIEEIKIAKQEADAKTMTAQAAMARAQQPAAPQGLAGPAGPHPMELQAKLMGEQNKAKQIEISARRDQMNDENRDLDREKDLQSKQMDMDRDQMNDAVRMQHERDMQQQGHKTDILKLAMQVQAKGKREK